MAAVPSAIKNGKKANCLPVGEIGLMLHGLDRGIGRVCYTSTYIFIAAMFKVGE
jgi:hypothetical protein